MNAGFLCKAVDVPAVGICGAFEYLRSSQNRRSDNAPGENPPMEGQDRTARLACILCANSIVFGLKKERLQLSTGDGS
ncbi:g6190 [Coccomyxa viridis]|uniref:G6190 protein n=1 Tax=Coccomyxa viridis TaxID=1274662 RepID=A0ABP1FW42_9CHLO